MEQKLLDATFVVVGGGIAGVSCAEQIATEDPNADVILVSASPVIKEIRNLLKLSRRVEQFDVEERPHSDLESAYPNIRCIIAAAVHLDADKRVIALNNGCNIRYIKLCICTGASPKATKFVKVECECEVAEIFEGEKYLKHFHDGDQLQSSQCVWPVYVKLTNGAVHGCDFVVSATGVVPNTDFLSSSEVSLAEDGGIKVNDNFQTNKKDVFSAGDACTASWTHAPHWFQMRLWTQARLMGMQAAHSMLSDFQGCPCSLDIGFDLFTHVTKFFGYKVILMGLYNGQKLGNDYEIILRTTPRREYVKTVMKDGRMVGAVLIGETDLEETFENLILNELDLSAFGEDILDPDVDIDDYFD